MLLEYKTKINSKISTGKFVLVALKTMNASDKALESVMSQGLQLVPSSPVSQTIVRIVIPA